EHGGEDRGKNGELREFGRIHPNPGNLCRKRGLLKINGLRGTGHWHATCIPSIIGNGGYEQAPTHNMNRPKLMKKSLIALLAATALGSLTLIADDATT